MKEENKKSSRVNWKNIHKDMTESGIKLSFHHIFMMAKNGITILNVMMIMAI